MLMSQLLRNVSASWKAELCPDLRVQPVNLKVNRFLIVSSWAGLFLTVDRTTFELEIPL